MVKVDADGFVSIGRDRWPLRDAHPIFSRTGDVVAVSKNLAGIRRYVAGRLIAFVDVSHAREDGRDGFGSGWLTIQFEDGAFFQTRWASYAVLCGFLRRWRNVHGSPLYFDGEVWAEGPVVTYHHARLRNANPYGC
jgi:hypothetical protein